VIKLNPVKLCLCSGCVSLGSTIKLFCFPLVAMKPATYRFTGFNTKTVNEIASVIAQALKQFKFSRFLLGCTFQNSLSDEAKLLLKKEFQPVLVRAVEKALRAKADFERPEVEILVNFNQDLVFFSVKPVFVCGRYKKFSREITQTVHYCYNCKGRGCSKCNYTGVLTKDSVQSLVEKHALPLFGASSAKFHGAGREDKDVRMLGSGRKFVLELIEPCKRRAGLKKLEREINQWEKGKIEVGNLRYCSKEAVVAIKAEKSDKLYEARVVCSKQVKKEQLSLLVGKKLLVEQRTPNRVKGRRADLVRERLAGIEKVERLSGKEFLLQVRAQSGLYIKELVSGDAGRTKPSISSLLENECECRELDVLRVIAKKCKR